MGIDALAEIQQLPGATALVKKSHDYWMEAPDLDVLLLAGLMKHLEGRLSTMTGIFLPAEETLVIYHYYLDGQMVNFKVNTTHNQLPSISSILPAADWIEREIHDLYKVEFTNHPHPRRLLQPVQMLPGLFREEGGAAARRR